MIDVMFRMKRWISAVRAGTLLAGLAFGAACHGGVGTPEGIGTSVSTLVPLSALPRAIDSAYGEVIVATPDCFAIAKESGGPHPEIETFSRDGNRLGVWNAVGNGPRELRAIDGFSHFRDTLVVWDRSNARLTYLNCRAVPIRSHVLDLVGFAVVATGTDTVFLSFDPISPAYGRWVFAGGELGDSVGPRYSPRLRGARDLFAAAPDGRLGVLDVSAGVLLQFRPGAASPLAVDTLPAGIQRPLREAMRRLRKDSRSIQAMPVTALAPLWIQFLGDDTLAIGYPTYEGSEGVAIAKWPIETNEFVQVVQSADSAGALGIYDVNGVVFTDSTVVRVSGDSLFRYRVVSIPVRGDGQN